MKLPEEIFAKVDQNYHDYTLRFSKVVIRIRKYFVSEIENYLHGTSTVDSDWIRNSEAFKLFRSCVHPEDLHIADNICKADFIDVISYLRSISYDPSINHPHYCPYCNWLHDTYQMQIIQNITFEPETPETSFEYDLENGDKIIFKSLPYTKELEIIKNKKDVDYIFIARDMLYNSIDKIVIDGVAYSDLELEEVKKYINLIVGTKGYNPLLTFLAEKKTSMYLRESVKCKNCNKEYTVTINEPYFFVQV
jgi:hypothetical protein